jgi:hypothetical protein
MLAIALTESSYTPLRARKLRQNKHFPKLKRENPCEKADSPTGARAAPTATRGRKAEETRKIARLLSRRASGR